MTDGAFQENVSDLRFVAWDTETTGISARSDSIVEIAALAFDEEFEHREFAELVRPPRVIPAEAFRVHGISNEMVAGAAPAAEVLARFWEFLRFAGSPLVLVAHNAAFDVGMVHGELGRLLDERGEILPTEMDAVVVLDSCALARSLLPDLPRHRLVDVATHFGVVGENYHRALGDVKVLKQVFLGLLGIAVDQIGPGREGLTLSHLVDLSGGYHVLHPSDRQVWSKSSVLPPRITRLQSLCGQDVRLGIDYGEADEGFRYVTPLRLKKKGYRWYLEAFCHRDQISKTFRADKIRRIQEASF